MGRWSNSVVFITGASAGIGEALARKLASEGATVAVGLDASSDLRAWLPH